MVRVEIDGDAIFQQVMQTPRVKAKVHERAAKIATRIRRDLHRSGIDGTVQVREHAHSNGRFGLDIAGSVADKDRRRAGRIARRAGRTFRR